MEFPIPVPVPGPEDAKIGNHTSLTIKFPLAQIITVIVVLTAGTIINAVNLQKLTYILEHHEETARVTMDLIELNAKLTNEVISVNEKLLHEQDQLLQAHDVIIKRNTDRLLNLENIHMRNK